MSIIETAVIGVKDLGSTISDQTGRAVDIARLKVSSAELKREIARRYEALGRVVYEAQKSGAKIDEVVAESTRNIEALYNRLESVNKRIAERQNKLYCPACSATVGSKSLYCSRCGQRLEPQRKQNKNAAEDAMRPEVATVPRDED